MSSNRARRTGIGRAVVLMLFAAMAMLPVEPAISRPASDRLDAARLRTRFVIALERTTPFEVSALSHPNRVVVDLPDVRIDLPPHPTGGAVGLVRGFRGGLAAPGRLRVVIDVTAPVVVEKAAIERGENGRSSHLVLEIVPLSALKPGLAKSLASTKIGGAGLGSIQPPLPRPAKKPAERAAMAFRPTIVLDPGHGGHDSGARRAGTIEKDVVLAFSLVLRDRLKATGRYNVLMTRNDDTFVELDARRDFAERHRASLFMAIHADYAGSKASGATIYSLRDRVANELQRSAASEVARNVLSETELQAIKRIEVADTNAVKGFLADLAQREVAVTHERTNVFARSIIEFMGDATPMMNNPDRSAAFRVLKTAKVPSVLVELAYVTNKHDAANLKSDAWRRKVADSLVTAIDNYFTHQVARLPM
ncbi:MAG: N-acetylmuramoyl-L-alanine amidase [Hyphomicrobiaceae bacterium]